MKIRVGKPVSGVEDRAPGLVAWHPPVAPATCDLPVVVLEDAGEETRRIRILAGLPDRSALELRAPGIGRQSIDGRGRKSGKHLLDRGRSTLVEHAEQTRLDAGEPF